MLVFVCVGVSACARRKCFQNCFRLKGIDIQHGHDAVAISILLLSSDTLGSVFLGRFDCEIETILKNQILKIL